MAAITSITEAPKMFGAYVSNISSSIGWGGQGGSCQMTLVEDPDNGVVVTLPEVGTACYFRFEKFYFGGIFQRYMYKESTSGRTYDITLESPAKILDGLQVILGGFEGTTFNMGSGYDAFKPYTNPTFTNEMNNIYNPFGHEENWTVGHLRDPARDSHFGKADINSVGFPAVRLLELIELISQGPDEDGIVASEFGGKAKFGESEYTIDLTELIDILKTEIPNFRVGGNVKNLNGILADCTDIIQYDYFMSVTGDEPTATTENADGSQTFNTRQFRPSTTVDGRTIAGGVEGTVNGGGVLGNPILTIKTVSRAEQPEPNWIKNQIASYKDDMLVSSETGKELSDTVTQRLVIGGDASRYYTADNTTFLPIWGKRGDTDGYHVEYTSAKEAYANPYHKVRIHGIPLGAEVPQYLQGSAWSRMVAGYYATIFELRMALSGYDTWASYKYFEIIKESNDWKNLPFNNFSGAVDQIIGAEAAGGEWGKSRQAYSSPSDFLNTFGTEGEPETSAKFAFEQVKEVAEMFWGCMFLVPLPREPGGLKNNFRWISDEGKGNAEAAWDIVDSAWAEPPPIDDISFYDGSGRLKAVSTWKYNSMKGQYGILDAEWAFTVGTASQQIATTKAQIEKDIYWVTDLSGETQPYAVCTCPQILEWDFETTAPSNPNNLAFILNHLWPPAPPQDPRKRRSDDRPTAIGYNVVLPEFFGIPQQSNRYKWGPWYKYGALNGKAEVVNDESLKPETFGKQSLMDEAGFAIAYAGVARMTASETGYVELAEYPAFNIAERFGDAGPYVTNLDISIGTGGVKTTYKFNTWTPNFGRLAKYNIDRISRINKSNLSFDQNQRKFWRKFTHGATIPPRVPDFGPNNGGLQGAFANMIGQAHFMRTFGNPHPEGGTLSITNMVSESVENYKVSYGNTQEQIFSPINIDKEPTTETSKPGFEKPEPGNDETGKFGDNKFIGATQDELNPYFSTVTGSRNNFIANVDFTSVLHGERAEDVEDVTLPKMTTPDRQAITTVRPIGLRGPLMLSGWGFDIADRPVPAGGVSGDDAFKFASNIVSDRRTWKSGPVNLMWDDERKVWAGGLQMVCGVLTGGDITAPADPKTPTSFKVKVLRKKESEKGKAFADKEETITCYNRDPSLEVEAEGEIWVMAVRLNYEWTPMWVGCPQTVES